MLCESGKEYFDQFFLLLRLESHLVPRGLGVHRERLVVQAPPHPVLHVGVDSLLGPEDGYGRVRSGRVQDSGEKTCYGTLAKSALL